MSKHESTIEDLDRPYEPNSIGLSGIVKFAVGLVILIVVTFALMKLLFSVLEQQAVENNGPRSPMALNEREQLPPEPRLQGAPGFGVESPNGRVNMELGAPQAEWRELIKQWDEARKHGNKDPKTGAQTSMSIDEAKAAFLAQNVKAKSGADAEKTAADSRKFISDASSGREASATRR